MKHFPTFSIYLIKPFNFYFLRKKIFKLKRTKWKQLRKSIRFIVKSRQIIKRLNKHSYTYKNRKSYIKNYKKLRQNKKQKYKNQKILRKNYYSTIKICPGPKGRIAFHRYFYKNLINHKNRVIRYFNTNFSIFYYKKMLLNVFNYENNIKNAFISIEYRLEVLLVRLKFFISKSVAKINILNNNILVNFQPFHPKGYVHSGDIITFKNNITFFKTYKKYLRHYFHCPSIV